ncbi:MAG: 2-C-methyl-D-erythritol 4-phosphate cytidylyltransferase [Clostridia bacterium]|nr:2-C-methyl-D-erythritol 4-phosphate cytidylyltransferase [Clostridia bacterium]
MNAALIFAGGVGRRMNSRNIPKQFLKIDGKPIIIYTIEHFENHKDIDHICVVCLESWIPRLKEYLNEYGIKKVSCIVPGGKDGQHSIRNGLYALRDRLDDDENTIVLIHDGVRPLIDERIITENIESVKQYGTAVTVAPMVETVANINENGDIIAVQERPMCRIARAPQSFYLLDIIAAQEKGLREGVMQHMVDSASLMIHYGFVLHTVDGPVENIKVTTPADFTLCKKLLQDLQNKDTEEET